MPTTPTPQRMNHRDVLTAMSGLLLGMFVAVLSSTVVSTALPRIIPDLGGTQSAYTWVVVSTLLAITVSTPVWGKLADLFDRKLLVQTGLAIFVIGSVLAGLAQSTAWLIGCRVLQGIGIGGLTALVQVILSDLVSPRERGRYAGYLGAAVGVGTVAGPLLGGLVTDAIGWRWCFYVPVPFAIAAFITLQGTLRIPARPRKVIHMDYAGIVLIAGGVSALLIWVSLAGTSYPWLSWQTATLVPLGIVLLALAVVQERRARQPVIPPSLFKERTVVLATIAAAAVGIAMFGTTVFLTQYMQIARGKSPTESGLLTIPMVTGLLLASTLIGRQVTRTGRYKAWMLTGAVSMTAGLALMGTMDETTSLPELAGFMLLVGAGIGMLMQNLVLVVQNVVPQSQMGAGSALVAFFRTLGGAIGVSVLGSLLAAKAAASIASGLQAAGLQPPPGGHHGVPSIAELPPPVARIVEHAYGTAIADVFLIAAPMGLVVLLVLSLMREKPLGTKSGAEITHERLAAEAQPQPQF